MDDIRNNDFLPTPSQSASMSPQDESQQDQQPGPSGSAINLQSRPAKGRKRFHPYPQERQITSPVSAFDTEMLNALRQLQDQQRQQQAQDPDEHYLLSLLPVLKSLDPISKMEFRGELNATALRFMRRSSSSNQYQCPQPIPLNYSPPPPPPNPPSQQYRPYSTQIDQLSPTGNAYPNQYQESYSSSG